MGYLKGTQINKMNDGLSRLSGSKDHVGLLVCYIPPHYNADFTCDALLKLIQLKDAESLGINESFDANIKVLVHHHISEFFRLSPQATLYFLPVSEPTIPRTVKTTITAIKEYPEIKGIGFAGFESTVSETADLVDSLQLNLVSALKKDGILIDYILLEGGTFEGALNALPDLRDKKAENISVVLGQDATITALDPAYIGYAAIGSGLGMLCVRQVSENIGSTNIITKPPHKKGEPLYSLTEPGLKRFESAAIFGKSINQYTNEELHDLQSKGYMLVGGYVGASGLFFSGSPTCTPKNSDYAYIERNRVWNKAARLIRAVLAPEIKGKVKKDSSTGFIAPTTIARWERACALVLESLEQDNDISGFEVYINPEQVLSETSPLKIQAQVVADDIVHSFEVDLGLTQKI